MQQMSILVTGGAGFIGSHVVDSFIGQGHRVTALDNLSRGRRTQVNAAATFIELDVRSPEAAELVSAGGFHAVAHLAAQIDVRSSVTDPKNDSSENVGGTLNLLEAVRRIEGSTRPRFILASTGGALYGDVECPPAAESHSKNPDAPYGVGKLAAELYMGYYGRVHGMDCVALRFGNVYGPRQDPHGEAGVIAMFCGRLVERKPFTVYGDGSQTRDYIFVRDVANAFVASAMADFPAPGPLDSRAFNVGTGVETSVMEIATALNRVSGQESELVFAPPRAGEITRSVLDPKKAIAALGWAPQTKLIDGLAATWEWTRAVTGA